MVETIPTNELTKALGFRNANHTYQYAFQHKAILGPAIKIGRERYFTAEDVETLVQLRKSKRYLIEFRAALMKSAELRSVCRGLLTSANAIGAKR
jgi:hypothetical protein